MEEDLMQVMDLCRPCVAAIEDMGEYHCHMVKGGVDNKVRCERCQRRRYGKTYRLEKRKEKTGLARIGDLFSEELLKLSPPDFPELKRERETEEGQELKYQKFIPIGGPGK